MSTKNPSSPAHGLLTGRRIVVTGVLTPKSIAFAIAAAAQAAGAEVMLTSFGRAMSLTRRSAQRLSPVPEVLEMDVTDVAQVHAVAEHARTVWGGVDGVVHAIGFAPADCLGGGFLEAPWSSVSTAFHVSSYSLQTLAAAFAPLMPASGGSIVTLTFDARVAWPVYDWMGPAKAALEAIVRYLARELGPRGNPGEHHLRGTAGDDRRAVDPRVRDAEVVLGTALPARLGQRRQRTGRGRHRVPAQRPVPRHHRRDDSRRRRLPLTGCPVD